MTSLVQMQYAFRAQKSLGLVGGALPAQYSPLDLESSAPASDVPATNGGGGGSNNAARMHAYSPKGSLYAVAWPTGVKIHDTSSGALLHELASTSGVVELSFSPNGTFLSTWERPVKPAEGSNAQHKNLRVWSSATGKELVGFTQKTPEGLQYTQDESKALRLISSEVTVFKTADWLVEGEDGFGKLTVSEKKKVEGSSGMKVSPGLNPSVAVFVPEKKGAPAAVKIFPLLTLASAPQPSSQKTFYKADRAQIKWNALGTACLVLTHTDVDNSNKSYYGETSLYLLHNGYGPRGDNGGSGERVILDKEGPIHDFSWSGSSKEFGVVYGFMPAKTVLFDLRLRVLHDFGPGPVNYLSFNPSSRLLLLAGFGNLAGQVSIYDRRSLAKVCTLEAPNTSHCEWSPDGKYLMTATLSPRLRVDNGIRVWYCRGELVHVHDIEELYQVGWKPSGTEPSFPNAIPAAPEPSPAAIAYLAGQKSRSPAPASTNGTTTPIKQAYRPPGARGLAAPSIFRREDEGGSPTPSRGQTPNPPNQADHRAGMGRGGRFVPGAQQRHSPSPGPGTDKEKEKRKRNKGAKTPNGGAATPGVVVEAPVAVPAAPPPLTAEETADQAALQKKIRNLNKKLKAIDELKEKQKRGEKLEATQMKKMEGEVEIKKELADLEKEGSA